MERKHITNTIELTMGNIKAAVFGEPGRIVLREKPLPRVGHRCAGAHNHDDDLRH